MRRYRWLTWVLLPIFLAGCSLAPKYERPEKPILPSWPVMSPEVKKMGWGCFITDHRLREVVQLALQNNRDVKLSALNVERVQAMYRIQRAELFPSVNAGASMARERVPGDLSITKQGSVNTRYDVNVSIVSWEIDFFGRLRNLKDQALEQFLASEEAHRANELALVSAVSQTYYSWAAARQQLELSRETLRAQEESYRLLERRFATGMASEIDLRRAQTQLESARADVARYIQAVAQAENALQLLVGTPLPPHLHPPVMRELSFPEEVSPGLDSSVLLTRPDVLMAEHRLKAAHANIGAARATFFPRITLTAAGGTASAELDGLFRAGSAAWSFVPKVSLPIFDARTWAAYDVAKVDRKIALADYEKTIQIAFREVADALAAKGALEKQLEAQNSLVEALKETYLLAQKRYEKGLDSYLSVLDAQRSLLAAERGLIDIKMALLTSRIALFKALGGGE